MFIVYMFLTIVRAVHSNAMKQVQMAEILFLFQKFIALLYCSENGSLIL